MAETGDRFMVGDCKVTRARAVSARENGGGGGAGGDGTAGGWPGKFQ